MTADTLAILARFPIFMQRALWDEITPGIRAIAMGWDPSDLTMRARFVFDRPVTDDDWETVWLVETEIIADSLSEMTTEFTAEFSSSRPLTHRPGETWWAYVRQEPHAADGSPHVWELPPLWTGSPAPPVAEHDYDVDTRIQLSFQRALWGAVGPHLRAVAIGTGAGSTSARFIFDRPATREDLETVRLVEQRVAADFEPPLVTTFTVETTGAEAPRRRAGESWWVYKRREHWS